MKTPFGKGFYFRIAGPSVTERSKHVLRARSADTHASRIIETDPEPRTQEPRPRAR